MSALAVYLKKKIDVSGSDIASNSNTKILEKMEYQFRWDTSFQC